MREEGLSRVAIIRCANYDPPRVVEALDHLIELLGGAEKNFPLEKNILLKPNLLKGAAPGKAVWWSCAGRARAQRPSRWLLSAKA